VASIRSIERHSIDVGVDDDYAPLAVSQLRRRGAVPDQASRGGRVDRPGDLLVEDALEQLPTAMIAAARLAARQEMRALTFPRSAERPAFA